MFRNTKEPSSGGEHLCLAKVTCGSMVLVHAISVSIVVAYISCCVCEQVAVRPVRCRGASVVTVVIQAKLSNRE